MKILKRIFKILVLLILFTPLLVLFLVRFTNMFISGENNKCLVCYNEETGNWTFNDYETYNLSGNDGPYIFQEPLGLRVISVEGTKGNFKVVSEYHEVDSISVFRSYPTNSELLPIRIRLQEKPFITDSVVYTAKSKVIAISDIEGNFDSFYGFLKSNGVIDSNYNWIFGDGRLVLNGDFVDRGADVTQVLWLIYHLETLAREAGGAVHFVLGNHEAMNLQKNVRYWNDKYRALAQQLSDTMNYKIAASKIITPENEMVQWLKSKNVLLKIGSRLFVHAGISPELLKSGLTLSEINQIARANIEERLYGKTEGDKNALLIMGRLGPLWYRGLKQDYKKYYKKASQETVDKICKQYNVNQIVIGHSIVDDVSTDFDGKVLRIDVKHGKDVFSDKTLGVLIENGELSGINGKGKRIEIVEIKYD